MKAAEDAEGTEFEQERAEECSAKIMRAREQYISKTKAELKSYKDKPKLWWKTTNILSGAPAKICSIPALKDPSKEWILNPVEKANLIAKTQAAKFTISAPEENKYSRISATGRHQNPHLQFPTGKDALDELSALPEDSATGSDTLPTPGCFRSPLPSL